jgi:hypothetical protein
LSASGAAGASQQEMVHAGFAIHEAVGVGQWGCSVGIVGLRRPVSLKTKRLLILSAVTNQLKFFNNGESQHAAARPPFHNLSLSSVSHVVVAFLANIYIILI